MNIRAPHSRQAHLTKERLPLYTSLEHLHLSGTASSMGDMVSTGPQYKLFVSFQAL